MRLFSHLTTMPPRCLLVESSWTRRSFHGKSLPAPHLSPPLNKLKGMETAQKTHYLRILKKSSGKSTKFQPSPMQVDRGLQDRG